MTFVTGTLRQRDHFHSDYAGVLIGSLPEAGIFIVD